MSRKLVTFIRNGEFKEAEALIKTENLSDIPFEKAYVLYRLNRDDEALEVLEQGGAHDFHIMELKAQIFYRNDRFEEAYNLLLTVIKNSDDEFDSERQANLLAIAARLEGNGIKKNPKVIFSTYEQYYNHACCLINRKQLPEALEILDKAEECCRDVLAEEGLTAEEIEMELSVITGQKDYVHHLMEELAAESDPMVNVDELEEMIFVPKSSKQKKESKKDVADTEIVTGKLRTKKRKRKTILPKNFDPAVKPDPERWLPRQERTAYKKWLKKHKDHDIGRGTQGAVSQANDMITESSSPRQSTPSAPVPEGPRQHRPNAQHSKKKGNKKKGKW